MGHRTDPHATWIPIPSKSVSFIHAKEIACSHANDYEILIPSQQRILDVIGECIAVPYRLGVGLDPAPTDTHCFIQMESNPIHVASKRQPRCRLHE